MATDPDFNPIIRKPLPIGEDIISPYLFKNEAEQNFTVTRNTTIHSRG